MTASRGPPEDSYYSTLRTDSGKLRKPVVNMASGNVRVYCDLNLVTCQWNYGAHVYCNSKRQNTVVQINNNVASRRRGGRFDAGYVFVM